MARFLAGFLVASLLWGGFLYAYTEGLLNIDLEPDRGDELDETDAVEAEGTPEPGKKPKRRKGKRRRSKRYSGESLVGDDLGGPDTRDLDMEGGGGEAQLLGHEIEQGFDQAFPQMRRCLILAAGDEPVTGKIVFGLRIAGDGRVAKVNLRGPSAVTKTEAGDCMRKAAKGIHFRSFDGPDMLVNYPLTLE